MSRRGGGWESLVGDLAALALEVFLSGRTRASRQRGGRLSPGQKDAVKLVSTVTTGLLKKGRGR